jgi:hypothetical protein
MYICENATNEKNNYFKCVLFDESIFDESNRYQ